MKRKWFAILLMVTLMLSNSLSILARDLSESELGDEYIEENNTEKILITDDKSDNSIVKKKTNMVSTINEIEEKEEDTDTQNNISSVMATSDNKSLFAGGTGTIEDPFQISDAEQFNNIRHNLSANYILVSDIDLSIYSNWNAIGTYENRFCGTFDGDNHSITGLTILDTEIDSNSYQGCVEYASLFGYCGKGAVNAVIKNIKMENISINISNKENTIKIGVISLGGYNTISNCSVGGSIDIRDCYKMYVGGIACEGDEIQSCISNITMKLESNKVDDENYHGEIICGGISSMLGNITNSYNYGEINAISGNFLRCGGICGIHTSGKISRCANYGDISGKTIYQELHTNGMYNCELGGIVGSDGDDIEGCVNYGNIEGSAPKEYNCSIGGIAGGGHYMSVCASIDNCFNLGRRMNSSNAYAYRIGTSKQLTECYSLDSTLIDGEIPTENIGAEKENGASLSEEEILKKIEVLGLDSDEKEDEEGTTTKEIIQGVIDHSYGSQTADTKVEELLSGYVNDWNSAYTKYTHAVEETLMNSIEDSAPIKKQAIKERKEKMMEEDEDPKNKEKYISGIFHDDKMKDAAYEGFSNFLYDTICSEIDISNISAEDINGTKLVNTILKSAKQASISKTYKINGIKVTIKTSGIENVSFGSITCNSSLFHTYTICSTAAQCREAIANYMKELMGLTDSAIYQVYSSVCKDVLGVSLDKLTEDYVSKKITQKVSKYLSKFEASGIGNLATNLNSCHNYYQYVKKMMGIIGSTENPDKILEMMQEYGKFEDLSISNKVVKKAWKELKKAATNLNKAYLSYLSGRDSKIKIWLDRIKPEWMKKDTKVKVTLSCPVNVIVLNSLGQQIGYAGEDDVWFDNDIIYIEERGDAKIIYSSSEESISFSVSATAYGVLGCSIEDYDEIGLPTGRTNYYDIELYPGKNITVSGIKNATDGKVDYTVTSDGQTINANEYIPSTQNAVVSIGCNVVKGGTVDGTGSYVRGDAAVLTATPSDNSRFVGWMQGEHLLDTARIYEFTAKENTTITALFVDISESESWDSNGSSGSNNELGDSQKPTDTNGTPNHNSQTDNNGTNKDNPVFTETSTNNTPTGTTSPQTGDENPLFMLIIIVLITGGIVAGSVLSSMKARKNA